jgi:phosphate transport system substrate-binding protein
VIANSKKAKQFNLTRKDLFLALAAKVPNPDGTPTVVANPYKTWKEVNPELPDMAIEVLGPPPTSGTRDAFVELVMETGGKKFEFIKAMEKADEKQFKAICHMVREDGPYIEAGENDNLIVQKLDANPNALGIFGFSFLDQNADKLQGSVVEGVTPVFEAIADGSYPVSRPLFFYVKKAHVDQIPGIREFLKEFTSEKAWGEEGYLTDKGLIPMPAAERKKYSDIANNLTPLNASDL